MTKLLDIQRLQFQDKSAAEQALKKLLESDGAETILSLTINTKPESLNSLNGIVEFQNGGKFFFKTHTEEEEQLTSYYNAETLASAGYPVVTPKQIEKTPGHQIAFYEVLTYPTVFDRVKTLEDEYFRTGMIPIEFDRLSKQIDALDKRVFACYKETFDPICTNTSSAAVHQLFWHRIQTGGRVNLFYDNAEISWRGNGVAFSELATKKWTINATSFSSTIADLVETARDWLDSSISTSTVIGHGDAHSGNIFIDEQSDRLLYFDPAFAGRHSPLLDLVKPTFHNVFSRWMYFPTEVANEFEIDIDIRTDRINIEHSFSISELRQQILSSRIENVLKPTIQLLGDSGALPKDLQRYIQLALFCCPFLTVNLMSPPGPTLAGRYPDSVKWLGFATALAMSDIEFR